MARIVPAHTETVGHHNMVWSIHYRHIATSAFHVLFKIMRSNSRCPIERGTIILAFEKTYVTQRDKRAIGRRDRRDGGATKRGKLVDYMAEFDGDATDFPLTSPSEDFR